MLQATEQSIVERLAAALPTQARVLPWPDSPIENGQPHGSAAIYVRFAGIDLGQAGATRGPFVQPGRIDFEIRLLTRDLRSHAGAYSLLEIIQASLSGWLPPVDGGYSFGLPGLQMQRMELIERLPDYSLWDWGARFRVDCYYEKY